MTTTSGRVAVGWRGVAAALMLLAVAATIGPRVAAAPAATPRLDWLFDGFVNATARVGQTLYVGGDFTHVVPSAGRLGALFAVSPATGAVVPSGLPSFPFEPSSLTPDGAGGYYVAGAPRGAAASAGGIVHVLANGSRDPAFQPPPGALIGKMVRVGPSLVIGGFLQVNGANRALIALDASTGALSSWTPALPGGDSAVWSVVANNGRAIVVSGSVFGNSRYVTAFDAVSGAVAWQSDVTGAPGFAGGGALEMVGGRLIVGLGRLYALDPATGAVDPAWAAGQPTGGSVFAIAGAGSVIYAGGTFTTFHGQPRAYLAAVDAATGALLPWSPQASDVVRTMTVSPSGTVFVGAPSAGFTINGVTRGVFAIDASGAVTAFAPQADVDQAWLVQMAQNGELFVAGTPAVVGRVARPGLAAFDLTTGALLPEAPVLPSGTSIRELVGTGSTLYMVGTFTTVNGQARSGAAAVDGATGMLRPWLAPLGGQLFSLAATGNAVYATVSRSSGATLQRLDAVTGAVDPSWAPTVTGTVVPDRGELLLIGPLLSSPNLAVGSRLGVLDPVTGQFTEWLRTQEVASYITRLLPDGDTLYFQGTDPTLSYGPFDTGQRLYAIDRKAHTPVFAPPVSGRLLGGAALVDGRVVVGGRNITVAGAAKYGAVEVMRTGAVTGWDPGFPPYAPETPPGGGAPGGTYHVAVRGDVLVMAGQPDSVFTRVAVFDMSGAEAPTGLRSRTAAGVIEFAWDPPATPPAGGYVLEGGFAPGQTAATLPVGTGTTFTTSASVLGPLFLRVRAAGSTEVSNEIVAGCVAPPLPPTALTTAMNGTMLTLSWTAPAEAVTGYVLSAGTAAGLRNVVTTALPGATTSVSGTVPGGSFYARVQATSACGASAPSGEVFFTIGAADPLPAAPTAVTATLLGSTLTLSWTAPAGPVTGYVLEAGSAPGLANIGAATIGPSPSFVIPGVPAGLYYVRVRAITSAGSGPPSADVVPRVP